MNYTNGFLKLKNLKIFGAEVFVHWNVLLYGLIGLSGWATGPIQAATCILLLLLLILLHEAGHAAVAKKLGYQPINISLKDIHGYCVYEYILNSEFEKDEAKIAWGGVLAQLTVAVPLIIMANTTSIFKDKFMSPVVGVLGYYSVLMVIFNLLPIKSLDGNKAWKLFPIILAERKYNKIKKRRPESNAKINRIK